MIIIKKEILKSRKNVIYTCTMSIKVVYIITHGHAVLKIYYIIKL